MCKSSGGAREWTDLNEMRNILLERLGLGFRVSDFGIRDSGFGFRVSGFNFWLSVLGLWVHVCSGFGLRFWFSVLWLRVNVFSGFELMGVATSRNWAMVICIAKTDASVPVSSCMQCHSGQCMFTPYT